MDRRLAGAKSALVRRGVSHTKPGSLLKSGIPMLTCAKHDEDSPGFAEIDLVGHAGRPLPRRVLFHPDIADIATGLNQNRTVRNEARVHVVAEQADVVKHLPSRSVESTAPTVRILLTHIVMRA